MLVGWMVMRTDHSAWQNPSGIPPTNHRSFCSQPSPVRSCTMPTRPIHIIDKNQKERFIQPIYGDFGDGLLLFYPHYIDCTQPILSL